MNKDSEFKSRFRKPYQELLFTDDYMFRKVLYHDKELCGRLAELLLDIEVEKIEYADQEHLISATSDSRGVRMDVYVRDDKGTVFDLEMQNLSEISLPKRTRFYQSMIDIEHLTAGEDYSELPDSYIVFICMFDPHEKGLPKYEFRELCLQDTSIELGSGASKVFINARSKRKDMSEEMRAFLDYLCGRGANSGLTKEIDAKVAHAKTFKPWEAEYMQLHEMISLAERDARTIGYKDGYAEGRVEGHAKGHAEGLAEGLAEGRAEGKNEGREEERISSILRLREFGLSEDQLLSIGYTKEEIES